MQRDQYILYCDGGARGNPGPAAAAGLLFDHEKRILAQYGAYLGITTNNVAEYRALHAGLRIAYSRNVRHITCNLDSMLVVEQLNGRYKVKSNQLRPLYDAIQALIKKFETTALRYVPRDHNTQADALVNQVLDSRNSNVQVE